MGLTAPFLQASNVAGATAINAVAFRVVVREHYKVTVREGS